MAKKQTKKKFECCGECECECENKEKDKQIKLYVCPRCKSFDVGYIFRLRNIFGIIPKMQCRKCEYEAVAFPIVSITKSRLNKLDKTKRKNKRKTKR